MKRREFLGTAAAAGALTAVGMSALTRSAEAAGGDSKSPVRVLVWSELTEPKSVYPNGLHAAIADYLNKQKGITARIATLTDPDQGVAESVLAETDVLIWYGHQRHGDVKNENVQRIVRRVRDNGLGFFALHSSHFSKALRALTGTECSWGAYVDDGKPVKVKVMMPEHPIAKGVKDFTVPKDEFYAEPFAIPKPDAVVLASLNEDDSEIVRDGICFTIGAGRVFYLRIGHEGYPIYFMPPVQKVIGNACRWLAKRA
ncbi:MAG TPA: ThuA domain-containing protein [Armatimonadota bacterium]|jgi:trehalose utilization protein